MSMVNAIELQLISTRENACIWAVGTEKLCQAVPSQL